MEIIVQNNDIVINRGNFEAAHEAIKNLKQEGQNTFSTFEEALKQSWGVDPFYDEFGNLTGVSFSGAKSFYESLFSTLAPFVTPGSYIEIWDDCSGVNRWNFNGATMQEQPGKVIFDNQQKAGSSSVYENKVIENAFGGQKLQKKNYKVNANWKTWAKNTSQYEDVQQTLEQQLDVIISIYFKGAGDYALEKLVKSFCEPMGMLERHLIKTEFPKINAVYGPNLTKQYEEVLDRIKKVMNSEIRRQARHYITFLSEVGTFATATAQTGG